METEQVIEDLVDLYSERLLRYATSILYHHQDAEDVVQDVFMSAYENLSKFDGKNISAWLYKMTYNKSLNKLKKRKPLLFADVPEIGVVNQAQTGLSDETLHALSLLKPQERAVLYGRIIEEYDYEELALQMGASPATLRKRYERAKKKFAAILNQQQQTFSKKEDMIYEQI